jgi:cell division protein ZapA
MTASMTENRNLTLTIGGRNHVISIAPGEEDHLRMLAQMIDERVRKFGLAQGQTEARMLLIAALVLADELHGLQNGGPPAPPPPPPPSPPPPAIAPALVAQIAQLADRVEKLAARLEQSGEGA